MIKLMPLLMGAVLVASCAPAIAPCGPASCEGGCCDVRGVCVVGRTKAICGVGGAACFSCEGTQACVAGACVMPPMDAGVDAGTPDAGEEPFDAGSLRTVRVRRTDEALLPDGGVRVTAFDLSTATNLRLLYEDATGTWVEVMPSAVGPELRYDGIPVGPYVVSRGFEYVVSDADDFELGARTLGKRDRVITNLNTTLTVQLQGVPPGASRSDALGLTSFGSGTTADFMSLTLPNDAGLATATTDLATAPQAFGMSGVDGDEVTVVLRRNVTDAGVAWSAAHSSATVTAPELASLQTAMTTVTLAPLAQELLTIRVRSSDFEQFAADVHPSAVPATTQAAVTSFLGGQRPGPGGDFMGRSTLLASTQLTAGRGDLSVAMTFGRPFGPAPVLVEGRLNVTVPLSLSGRTLNRSVDAMGTTRADGGVLEVTLTPPRFLRLNGESATVNRTGVGLTPVLEWSQPAVGTPGTFVVTILKVTPQGTTLSESFAAQVRTPFSRLRVPPFALTRGEAYFAFVSAVTTTGFDPRRFGFHNEREAGRATAATAIFTP